MVVGRPWTTVPAASGRPGAAAAGGPAPGPTLPVGGVRRRHTTRPMPPGVEAKVAVSAEGDSTAGALAVPSAAMVRLEQGPGLTRGALGPERERAAVAEHGRPSKVNCTSAGAVRTLPWGVPSPPKNRAPDGAVGVAREPEPAVGRVGCDPEARDEGAVAVDELGRAGRHSGRVDRQGREAGGRALRDPEQVERALPPGREPRRAQDARRHRRHHRPGRAGRVDGMAAMPGGATQAISAPPAGFGATPTPPFTFGPSVGWSSGPRRRPPPPAGPRPCRPRRAAAVAPGHYGVPVGGRGEGRLVDGRRDARVPQGELRAHRVVTLIERARRKPGLDAGRALGPDGQGAPRRGHGHEELGHEHAVVGEGRRHADRPIGAHAPEPEHVAVGGRLLPHHDRPPLGVGGDLGKTSLAVAAETSTGGAKPADAAAGASNAAAQAIVIHILHRIARP